MQNHTSPATRGHWWLRTIAKLQLLVFLLCINWLHTVLTCRLRVLQSCKQIRTSAQQHTEIPWQCKAWHLVYMQINSHIDPLPRAMQNSCYQPTSAYAKFRKVIPFRPIAAQRRRGACRGALPINSISTTRVLKCTLLFKLHIVKRRTIQVAKHPTTWVLRLKD